jgi:hypothetical protein
VREKLATDTARNLAIAGRRGKLARKACVRESPEGDEEGPTEQRRVLLSDCFNARFAVLFNLQWTL